MNPIKRFIKASLYYSGVSALYGRLFLTDKAVILGYHRVETNPPVDGLSVTPEVFAMQMKYLSTHWNVLPLSDLVEALKSQKAIPRRSCVVTFDDGTLDNFEVAFPILKQFSIPATFFVIGNKIQQSAPLYFNPKQADELLANGHALGAHSQTHPHLTKISEEQLTAELTLPLQYLQRAHGIPSPAFAYPYGDFDEDLALAVGRSGYVCAVTTRPGFVTGTSNLFALPRIQIDQDATSGVASFATRLQWIPRSTSTQ